MAEAARRCNVRDTPWKRIQNVLINNDLKGTQQTECILQIFIYQQTILRINDSIKRFYEWTIRKSFNKDSAFHKYFYINKKILRIIIWNSLTEIFNFTNASEVYQLYSTKLMRWSRSQHHAWSWELLIRKGLRSS